MARSVSESEMSLRSKIAYIEDDPVWQNHVQSQLANKGFAVICFSDGGDALRAIRADKESQIAAVLIDYRLLIPGTTKEQNKQGDDLCREIEEIRPTLPRFILSEYPEKGADPLEATQRAIEIWTRCNLMSSQHYISKSFLNIDKLVSELKRAITENSRAQKVFEKRPKLLSEYLKLKLSADWPAINQKISQEAEELIELYENGDIEETLGSKYSTKGSRGLFNMLVARRAVIGMIAKHYGSFMEAQILFNYSDPSEAGFRTCPHCRNDKVPYYATGCDRCRKTFAKQLPPTPKESRDRDLPNHMTFTSDGFKRQCRGNYYLNIQMIRNQEGLLSEEEEWFDQYRQKLEL
jgi:CheY-like chemotaxis protein